jgi:hypothetical protein
MQRSSVTLFQARQREASGSPLQEAGAVSNVCGSPGADGLIMRIYAAMTQKERELISERTKAALAAAQARGKALGGDRGYRPASCLTPALQLVRAGKRRSGARIGGCWNWKPCVLKGPPPTAIARAMMQRGAVTPSGGSVWTHATVSRVLALIEPGAARVA